MSEARGISKIEFADKIIRMVGEKNDPLFLAKDVARCLGIRNLSQAVSDFAEDEKTTIPPKHNYITESDIVQRGGTGNGVLFLTLPGLFRLTSQSVLPEAKALQRKINHEVMPCIWKHGCYPEPLSEHGTASMVVADKYDLPEMVRDIARTCYEQNYNGLAEGISRGIGPYLSQLNDRQDTLESISRDTSAKVCFLEEKMEANTKAVQNLQTIVERSQNRKNLNQATKDRHIKTVHHKFNGKCPCCMDRMILNEDGDRLPSLHFDHWYQVSQNKVHQTMPVCWHCNTSVLNSPGKRAEKQSAFDNYQAQRNSFENARRPLLPLFIEEANHE